MRINKYLASCGIASRRKAEDLIINGKVKINGKLVNNLGTDVKEHDIVTVNDNIAEIPQSFEYYMLNKPKGYVCSANDDRNRKIVTDLIPTSTRIYPVGRLDYDSQGLLLLTNDGDLTFKLTHPKGNVSKTYIVKIEGSISNKEINFLKNGVVIDGVKLRKCNIKNLGFENNQTKLEIIIYEGRNREIRKMLESVNKTVVMLKRTKIGELKLGGLNRGEFRKLTNQEINYLKSLN